MLPIQILHSRRLLVLLLLATFVYAPPASAQQAKTDEESAAEEIEPVRPTFDLGHFKINDLRPTRNETAKLTFKIHLALSPEVSEKQLEQFEHWQHRLRNQVIIAIRTIETKEFQAANLALLRRKVRIRINRMLKAHLVEDILLTEYLFRLH